MGSANGVCVGARLPSPSPGLQRVTLSYVNMSRGNAVCDGHQFWGDGANARLGKLARSTWPGIAL